jgi:hypothetical protein
MSERVGREEARNTESHSRPVGPSVCEARKGAAEIPDRGLLHAPPEFLQPRQAVLRRVAGDQAGVDRPDGGADNPVRLDSGLVQRLIDTRLVRSENAAALQHQDDLAKQHLCVGT